MSAEIEQISVKFENISIATSNRNDGTVSEEFEVVITATSKGGAGRTRGRKPSSNSSPDLRKRFKGKFPNVKWKHLPKEVVVQHDRFVPLHEEAVPNSDSAMSNNNNDARDSNNNIAQRTEAWHKMRKGNLTASQFNKVLGFFEKKASKKLKMQTFATHNNILESFYHLIASTPSQLGETSATDNINALVARLEQFKVSDDVQIKMNWGTHHEGNAIVTYLEGFKQHKVKETGFWVLTEERLPKGSPSWESLPPIGASPDGIVHDVDSGEVIALLEAKCPCPFMPIANANDNSNSTNDNNDNNNNDNKSNNQDGEEGRSSDTDARSSSSSSNHNHHNNNLEPEVPEQNGANEQQQQVTEGAARNPDSEYQYIVRKPHAYVPVYYIPQIQGQLMVTGVKKCMFVSWTPTKGTNVFEVPFVEDYCAQMLKFFDRFYNDFVLPRIEPPEDPYWDVEGYEDFLNATLELQSRCTLVATLESEVMTPRKYKQMNGNNNSSSNSSNDSSSNNNNGSYNDPLFEQHDSWSPSKLAYDVEAPTNIE